MAELDPLKRAFPETNEDIKTTEVLSEVNNDGNTDNDSDNHTDNLSTERDSVIPKEHKHGIETRGRLSRSEANDTDGRQFRVNDEDPYP